MVQSRDRRKWTGRTWTQPVPNLVHGPLAVSRSVTPSRTHPGRPPPLAPCPGHVLCTCSHIHHPSRFSGCIPVLSAPFFTVFPSHNDSVSFALVTPQPSWATFPFSECLLSHFLPGAQSSVNIFECINLALLHEGNLPVCHSSAQF